MRDRSFVDVCIHSSDHSIIPWITTEIVLACLMLIVAAFWTTLDMAARQDASNLTMQEWWWAMEDGYLNNAVEYYFKIASSGTAV